VLLEAASKIVRNRSVLISARHLLPAERVSEQTAISAGEATKRATNSKAES
jgi:hypothetical protein